MKLTLGSVQFIERTVGNNKILPGPSGLVSNDVTIFYIPIKIIIYFDSELQVYVLHRFKT